MSLQLIAVALFFAAIGVFALLWPARVYQFFNVNIESADGRNEIRAVYGGMCLAVAAALFAAPQLGSAANGVILTVMLLLVGMVAGRLVSLMVERTSLVPVVFLASELLGAGLLFSVLDLNAVGMV